jgi:D-alanyl-D-alanine carboxypeptidase (penicillin-binding protein 5/6)
LANHLLGGFLFCRVEEWKSVARAYTILAAALDSMIGGKYRKVEILRRSTPARTAATLIALALVLTLVPGSSGWVWAVSQKNTGGEQTAAEGAAPGQPELQAQSWVLTDAETGLYLAGKNPDERLPIASTTNVMTALVVLEEGVNLDNEVVVPKEAERFVGFTYSNVGLIAGERLTVRDLLVATLVPSGTDAVYTMAYSLGGGSVDNFVDKMNAKAAELGLKNTHFANPAGVDSLENYSSARDLAKIARAAMEHPVFDKIVAKERATISTQNRNIDIFTTNNLLYTHPSATGVKTGTSPAAGPCLVASAKDGGESYIAVVLHAEDEGSRFETARQALGFGFNKYERQPLVRRNAAYGKLPLPYRRGESVELTAAQDIFGLTGPSLKVERRVTKKDPPPAVKAGQQLGIVEVLIDGQNVESSPLVAKKGYEEASLWDKARYAMEWPAQKVWGWLSSRVAMS